MVLYMPPAIMRTPDIPPTIQTTGQRIGEELVSGQNEIVIECAQPSRLHRFRAWVGGVIVGVSNGRAKSSPDNLISENANPTIPDTEPGLPIIVGYARAEQTKPDLVWNLLKPDATRALLRQAREERLRRQDSV
jgi:hypothetical protein